MAGTPLLDRPTSPPKPPPDESRSDHRDRWFAVIVVLFLLAAAAVIGLATGARWFATPLAPDDGTDTQQEPAVDEPAAEEPAEEPADEPAEEPAQEPADNPPAIRYREEPRANWIVVGVAADDVLNVRAGPGVSFEIIAGLPPTSPELESTGRIADVGEQLWREIVVPGDGVGWVNAAYLGEIPAPSSQLDIRYREELRANWDVTGVAADDVLNVRAGPGVAAEIVATLPPDTVELESTGRIADVGTQLWREIVVPGDGVGWVNAAYLTETK